eukprot:TRINITY_DN5817_c1_g1_i1.p1 TRINITY_DN5817_c1_g1~~TRINITY_DN5817_c1_g1_i1.p1  ORF type:complete len:509 (+),score=67.12 TRINITY_DN5817_c1_g1_i1:1242-2768(+)
MVLHNLLREATARADRNVPQDLRDQISGSAKKGEANCWESRVPNPDANGLRRMFLEAETITELNKISQAALQTLADIRRYCEELRPGGRREEWPDIVSNRVNSSSCVTEPHSESDEPTTPAKYEIKEVSEEDVENMVSSALKKSDKICTEKALETGAPSSLASWQTVGILARWIAKEWRQKNGDVLEELLANLESPVKGKRLLILKAAEQIRTQGPPRLSKYNDIQLFVMTLYTMSGHDVDQLMGFGDTTKKRSVNSAMFSTINGAMRGSVSHDINPSVWPWGDIRKWVKTIVLLMSLSSPTPKRQSFMLSRGLAGLPSHVVNEHAKLKQSEPLLWPAPSSCAIDPSVSRAYIEGNATNAVKTKGGSLLFEIKATCGLPLQDVSKYPKEAEVLLPPLSDIQIESVSEEAFNDSTITVIKGIASCKLRERLLAVCTASLTDSQKASDRLREEPTTGRKSVSYPHENTSPRRTSYYLDPHSPLLTPTRAWEGKILSPANYFPPDASSRWK